MYPNRIDHYRDKNERNEVRPDSPVPLRSQNNFTNAEQSEFFEMYYLCWRGGEEFDKAGTGVVNYKPAPLSDIYDSYCQEGFHPVLKRTFLRELEQLDFEYVYGTTPGMDMSFSMPRRNTGPDDEVKLPSIKTFPPMFEHADPVIRLIRNNIVESVLGAIA